jgi:biopolymer transport protein ExbB
MHTAAPFHGSIDEVRISSVARSAEWIQTEYNNQKAPAAFYTVGIEESPGAGADPLNNGWSFRKRLTIDSAQIGCDLTNFPLLIKTTDPDLTQAQGDFDDILFTAADGSTKLDHEIEKYNSATGEIVAWVEVTSVSSTTDTDIYIYYANATAVDQRNPTGAGVWEPNYVGVYHLAEDPSITTDGHCGGGSVHACDSTSNDNDGTSLGGMQPGDLVPAQIGNGLVFDGNDDEIQINTTTDFDASVVTVQGNASVLFSNTGNTSVNQMTDNFYNDGNWHHVVAVSDHSDYTNIKIYVDGSSVSTSTDIEAWGGSPGNNPSIANQIAAGSFFGTLDEIRVSIGERDACWIEQPVESRRVPHDWHRRAAWHCRRPLPERLDLPQKAHHRRV